MAGLLFFIAVLAGVAQASEIAVTFGAPQLREFQRGGDIAFAAGGVAYWRLTRRSYAGTDPAPVLPRYPAEIVLLERANGEVRWSLPLTLAHYDELPHLATTSSGRLVASVWTPGARALLVIDANTGSIVARHDAGSLIVNGIQRAGERLFAFGLVYEGGNSRPAAIELDAQGGFVRRIEPVVAPRETFYFESVLESADGSVMLHAYEVKTVQSSFFYHSRLFAVAPDGEVGPELVPPPVPGVPEAQIWIQAVLAHAGGYWIAGRYRQTWPAPNQPYLALIGPEGEPGWVRSDLPIGATSGSIVDLASSDGELLTLGVGRTDDTACLATLRVATDGGSPATGPCDAVPSTLSLFAKDFEFAADGSSRAVGYDAPDGEPLEAFEWKRDAAGRIDTRTAPLPKASRYSRIVYEPGGDGIAFEETFRNESGQVRVVFGHSDFVAGLRFAFEPGEPIGAMLPPFPVEGTNGRAVLVRNAGPEATVDLATIGADWRLRSRVPFGPGGLPGFEARFAVADGNGVVYALGKDGDGSLVAGHSATPWSVRLPSSDQNYARMLAGPTQAFLLLSQAGECRFMAMDASGLKREETLDPARPVALLRSPQGRLFALCGDDSWPKLFDVTASPAVNLGWLTCPHPIIGFRNDGTLVAFTLEGERSSVCQYSPSGEMTEHAVSLPAGGVSLARVEDGVLHTVTKSTDQALRLMRVSADLDVEVATVSLSEAEQAIPLLAFGPDRQILMGGPLAQGQAWRLALLRADGTREWSRESLVGDRVLPPLLELGGVAWDAARPVLNVAASLHFGGPEAASVRIDVEHVFRGDFESD